MSKEKMVELKIKIPERWANFIDEYYKVTGVNREKDMMSSIESIITGLMIEGGRISLKDRVRLVDKYKLADIYKIDPWVRGGVEIQIMAVDEA
jgi:predicted secreted Zn-dependent protease